MKAKVRNNGTTAMSGTDKVVAMFADKMVERMSKMNEQGAKWSKNWLSVNASCMMPQNINGREYTALNSFILALVTDLEGYAMPVYMTCKQANEAGAHIVKGEKAMPVLFWSRYAKNKTTGEYIKIEQYDQLSESARKEYETAAVLRYYHVFNVQQTTLKEDAPKVFEKLQSRCKVVDKLDTDTTGMYVNAEIDDMVENQSWVCPINVAERSGASYSPSADIIKVPCKYQFTGATRYEAGQEFYSTLLHEMAHSTGAAKRLNRLEGGTFGDKKYAKEELVAELTAALFGHRLGFATSIQDNNACYLAGWCKTMKAEPRFLISVLADVNKAYKMMETAINAR